MLTLRAVHYPSPRLHHAGHSAAVGLGSTRPCQQVLDDGEELHQYWHGIELQSLAGRPAQYLFARFAWDIFPRLHTFLRAGRERALLVCRLDGTIEDRKFVGPECWLFTESQGRNRSASPTKRSRSQAKIDADSAVGGLGSRSSKANRIGHDYEAHEDRGRKRQRKFN